MGLLAKQAVLMRLIGGAIGWMCSEIARAKSLCWRVVRNVLFYFSKRHSTQEGQRTRAASVKADAHIQFALCENVPSVKTVQVLTSHHKDEATKADRAAKWGGDDSAQAVSPEKSPGLSPKQREILQRARQLYKTSATVIRPVNHRAKY